jgi:hypothetical protein
MVGAVVSVTVTVKVQVSPTVELLLASITVAVKVTVVVAPAGKKVPAAGELVTLPQSPVVSESKLTSAPRTPPTVLSAATVMSRGHTISQVLESLSMLISALAPEELSNGRASAVALEIVAELVTTVPS